MSVEKILEKISTIIVYLFPFITIIGLLSNLIAFVIFSRKKFKNTVFATYFRFLALFDTLSLLLPLNKYLELKLNIHIMDMSNLFCKLRIYLTYSIPPMSGYILVLISLDRWISISMPTKFLFRKKIIFQVGVTILMLMINLIFYSVTLASHLSRNISINTTNITTYRCYEYKKTVQIMSWLDLFNYSIVPFSLMIVFTSITLRTIFGSRKRIFSIQNNQLHKNNSNSSSRTKDIKFAITSVVLNIIFLVLNIPFCIFAIVFSHVIKFIDSEIDYFFYVFTLFFNYINFGTAFFINFVVNSIFRKEFLLLFRIKSHF